MTTDSNQLEPVIQVAAFILGNIIASEGLQVSGRSDGIDVTTHTSIALDFAYELIAQHARHEAAAAARQQGAAARTPQAPCPQGRGGRGSP